MENSLIFKALTIYAWIYNISSHEMREKRKSKWIAKRVFWFTIRKERTLLFFIISTERSNWPAFHMKKYLKDINSPWKDEQGDIFLFKKKCFVQNQNVLEWEQ